MFLAYFESDADLVWVTQAAAIDTSEIGKSEIAFLDVGVLSDGSAVVVGYFYGTATFGESGAAESTEGETVSLPWIGEKDVLILRLDADGRLVWASGFGGRKNDEGLDIATARDADLIATGDFMAQVTFGKGAPWETTYDATDGNLDTYADPGDIFLLHLVPPDSDP